MKLLIFFAFILNTFCLSGQVITGKVINEKKEPVPYANVVFVSKDKQTFIKGTTTDEQGVFSVSGMSGDDKGNILVKISCLGYSTLQLGLLSLPDTPITLKDDTELLDEVVVKARKIPYKMHQGILIADVKNSPLSKLGTANDIIGKLPFVTGKEGNFTVFGKGSPQIYINNRLVRNNSELGLLTSREIKDIAVITSPDSEYDASVGAVIKITTIRPRGEGFSGSVFTSAGRGEQFEGLVSASLNYRIKKWDFFVSGAYNRSNRENHSEQKQAFAYDGHKLSLSGIQNQGIKGKNYFPGIGFNFLPDGNNSLGFSYKGVFADTDIPSQLDMVTQRGAAAIERQKQINANNNKNHQHILNGYYSAKLSKKLKLDASADFVAGGQRLLQHTSFADKISESIEINSGSSFDVWAGKAILEYTPRIGSLRMGAEYTKTGFKQSYITDRTDIGLINSSDESLQNRFSAFSSYRAKISDWAFNTGIRYEFIKGRYYSNGELQEEQSPVYNYFFPSISVSYEPRAYQVTLSYNPRITYPSYTQLRNFSQYTSPFVYESGNPGLQPVLKHIMQLVIMRKNIRLMGSYMVNKRMIYPIMDVMKDRPVIMRMYDNLKTMRTANFVASYSLHAGYWGSMWELGINKQWLDIADMSYNKPRWSYKWQNNFKFPKRYSLRVDFTGSSKGNSGLAYYNKLSYSLDFNLSKSFNNLDINLSVNDIFRTAGNRWDILYNSISWNEDKYFDSRNVRISLSYRFNATNRRYKGRTENDELNRLHYIIGISLKENIKIPVYAINLPNRSDRKAHIIAQFRDKPEYEFKIISGLAEYDVGSYNLWLTIQQIVKMASEANHEYFILCEDDHQFTDAYSFNFLIDCIDKLREHQPDIILGGVSGLQTGVQINKNLFWLDKFSGLQFTIIFQGFYQTILQAPFSMANDTSDHKISSLSSTKFVIYPFISVQREFGGSDVTQKNNVPGTVGQYFVNSERLLTIIANIRALYQDENKRKEKAEFSNFPIYTNYPGQWRNLSSFQPCTIYPIISGQHGIISWESMKNILITEQRKGSDCILIQTKEIYSMDFNIDVCFFKKIIEGHNKNADIMLNGCIKYNLAVPITANLAWIDSFKEASFMIVFKKAISEILNITSLGNVNACELISSNIINKFAIYPTLSNYNGISPEGYESLKKLEMIKSIRDKFSLFGDID